MNSKNSLLIGRGIFMIIIIVALGLLVMSEKKDEDRRAILPNDLKNVKNKEQLYF